MKIYKLIFFATIIIIFLGLNSCSHYKESITKKISRPSIIVQGYVRDKATKIPAPGISININNDYPVATSDQNGFFQTTINHNLFTIYAVGPDICSPSVRLDASTQDTVNLILETKPSGTIKGTIINEKKEPIPQVSIRYVRDMFLKDYTSNQDGKFLISNIDPDNTKFTLYIFGKDYKAVTLSDIQFPSKERQLPLTIELQKQNTITVSGYVTDSANKPIGNVEVSYGVFDNWKQYKVTTTDNNGQFLLTNIQLVAERFPDDDNMIFFAKSKGYAPTWYKLKSSQDTILQIVLPTPHYVSGRIVDTHKNPISPTQISVMAYPAMKNIKQKNYIFNTWQHYYFPDDQGRFIVEDLPSQEVKFYFFGQGYTPIRDTTLILDRDDLVITLQPSGEIAGIVTDDETGNPVHSFKVNLDRPKNNPGTRIYFPLGYYKPGVNFNSEDGLFNIKELALGETIRVIVEANGYTRQEIDSVPVRKAPLNKKDKLIFRMKRAN